jgi:hypothetical protein
MSLFYNKRNKYSNFSESIEIGGIYFVVHSFNLFIIHYFKYLVDGIPFEKAKFDHPRRQLESCTFLFFFDFQLYNHCAHKVLQYIDLDQYHALHDLSIVNLSPSDRKNHCCFPFFSIIRFVVSYPTQRCNVYV